MFYVPCNFLKNKINPELKKTRTEKSKYTELNRCVNTRGAQSFAHFYICTKTPPPPHSANLSVCVCQRVCKGVLRKTQKPFYSHSIFQFVFHSIKLYSISFHNIKFSLKTLSRKSKNIVMKSPSDCRL